MPQPTAPKRTRAEAGSARKLRRRSYRNPPGSVIRYASANDPVEPKFRDEQPGPLHVRPQPYFLACGVEVFAGIPEHECVGNA
jgi:hypothetical protein